MDKVTRLQPISLSLLLPRSPRLSIHAHAVTAPDFPVPCAGIAVESRVTPVRGGESRVDELHGRDGVGAEGDAGADLGKARGGFIDVWGKVRGGGVLKEAEQEGEAADATADDGEAERMVGRRK